MVVSNIKFELEKNYFAQLSGQSIITKNKFFFLQNSGLKTIIFRPNTLAINDPNKKIQTNS